VRTSDGRLSKLQKQKLILAFGWLRAMGSFGDRDMATVSAWAMNPGTPQSTLDAVLDGTMSIDLVDGRIVLGSRPLGEVEALRRAFRCLEAMYDSDDDTHYDLVIP
jgi:hypothetical protein